MNTKHAKRIRRGLKAKAIQKRSTEKPRLIVYRSALNIYAQIVKEDPKGSIVLASASTLVADVKNKKGSKVEKAREVGKLVGIIAKEKNISCVAFDRSGYMYHGRVKALAEGAREAGLNF